MRILRRKKNLHKPLAFAQALARVVVVSNNNQPTIKMTTTETLTALAISISSRIAASTEVCEFSSEDSTPTLHVNLWRGYTINDLPALVAELKIVAEGFWDGGRSYSLQA